MQRRSWMRLALLPLAAQVGDSVHADENYPARPVTILVPFTAGGPTDVFFRALAEGLSKQWGSPVVVDNRPGANESIAAVATARAAKDGYTLFGASEGALLLNPLLYRKLPYDPARDFAPVTLLAKGPLVFAVPATMPVNTMAEFIAYAKTRSATRPVAYGSTGMGGTTHLAFSALERQHGIQLNQVNYKGVVNVLQDMLSGNVEAGVFGPPLIEGYVRSGKLKALAIPAPRRAASLPDVPTFAETGVPEMKSVYELTLVAPSGTPPSVVEKIAASSRKVLLSSEFLKKNVEPFGLVPAGWSPEEFGQYLAKERPLRAQLVRESGVEIQD